MASPPGDQEADLPQLALVAYPCDDMIAGLIERLAREDPSWAAVLRAGRR